MTATSWKGYIELNDDRGVVECEIIFGPQEFAAVWILNGFADNAHSRDSLIANQGRTFFASLDDYRAGRCLSIDDVWP